MESHNKIQQQFFEKIREKLNPEFSLVHEISETLGISYDSAYRRLRGEKKLTLTEAFVLANHFHISFDQFNGHTNDVFLFKTYHIEPQKFDVIKWVDFIYNNLKELAFEPECKMIYAAKDPPIFQYFMVPEILAFKLFFWRKTLFYSDDLAQTKFKVSDISQELVQKCKAIANLSLTIPITEIWNEDTFRILIRQIEYYWVSDYFESKEDLVILIERLEQWLDHYKKEAELGIRFPFKGEPNGQEGKYQLYENEIVINDNAIHVNAGNKSYCYLTYNVLGLLCNNNKAFCDRMYHFMENLISKSNLISAVGEKERNRFFNKLHDKIDQFKLNYKV